MLLLLEMEPRQKEEAENMDDDVDAGSGGDEKGVGGGEGSAAAGGVGNSSVAYVAFGGAATTRSRESCADAASIARPPKSHWLRKGRVSKKGDLLRLRYFLNQTDKSHQLLVCVFFPIGGGRRGRTTNRQCSTSSS